MHSAYTALTISSILRNWQLEAPIQCPTDIQGVNELTDLLFSYPDLHEKTNHLSAKGLDCLHDFTHLRVRTCNTGVCGDSPEAWKTCVRSNETIFKIPLIKNLLDKQSVLNARTNFVKKLR